jgi:hypothetical protein
MTRQFKGSSPLALLADSLPVRARIGLALVAADMALDRLKSSHDLPFARRTFELARGWYDGKRFDLYQFEDAIAHEYDRDLTICAIEAKSKEEKSAWLALECAVLYIAFHAYQAAGEHPSPMVSEVDETVLDDLDKWLRKILPTFMSTETKAAGHLEQQPGASFAQLKSMIWRETPPNCN